MFSSQDTKPLNRDGQKARTTASRITANTEISAKGYLETEEDRATIFYCNKNLNYINNKVYEGENEKKRFPGRAGKKLDIWRSILNTYYSRIYRTIFLKGKHEKISSFRSFSLQFDHHGFCGNQQYVHANL